MSNVAVPEIEQEKLEQIAAEVYTEAMTGDFPYQVAYRVLDRAPTDVERRNVRDRLLRFMYERRAPWSSEDIRSWIESTDDLFGFTLDILAEYLAAPELQRFVKSGTDLSKHEPTPQTWDGIVGAMREYMEFAWDKARNHRGLSAGRSVLKMQAWLWLLGDSENLEFADKESNYPQYGAPVLRRICEAYGFPIPDYPELHRMAEGKPCRESCHEGCGV